MEFYIKAENQRHPFCRDFHVFFFSFRCFSGTLHATVLFFRIHFCYFHLPKSILDVHLNGHFFVWTAE